MRQVGLSFEEAQQIITNIATNHLYDEEFMAKARSSTNKPLSDLEIGLIVLGSAVARAIEVNNDRLLSDLRRIIPQDF